GFHNAPRLYGDTTVRTPIRITGIKSGFRAAGEELAFGAYDGITGLWLQPYRGARDHGALGLVQGVGKGLGGFVLKDLAAIFGPIAYTMKGVHKEMGKGKQPMGFVRRSRMVQGAQDYKTLDDVKRRDMDGVAERAWRVVTDVMSEMEGVQKEGWRKKMAFRKESRRLVREGKFESVGSAAVALERWKMGRSMADGRGAVQGEGEGRIGEVQ
ncbi:MAG: hypothetical protein Q9183_007413, partial [Haloplaca sp. 2 TL-2023]